MTKEQVFFLVLGAALIILFLYLALTNKKRRYEKLKRRVRASYGKIPDREYTTEELQKIKSFFDAVHDPECFAADDITWNDLAMDTVFTAINHTYSSVGEEMLYALLREPCFDADELKERDRVARFFEENPEIREQMSVDFAMIGRTRKFSLICFMQNFKELKLKSDLYYLLPLFLLLTAVIMIFAAPQVGVILLLAAVIINLYLYYKRKSGVEAYYYSLSAMTYLVESALKIEKYDVPELKAYTDRIREYVAPVKALMRTSGLLGAGTSNGTAGDLSVLLDYLRMLTHLDFIVFNRMVRLVRNREEDLIGLMKTMGYLEAMISVASFRKTLPYYCTMDVSEDRELSLEEGYHLLISKPVPNSIVTIRPILITGSNASGKSTFLKMTALNALLAQTLNTVLAKSYKAPFFRIYSSMMLTDSIETNESYYMVEIRSIKRIMDAAEGAVPVLCFVDEVLRGTNTVERIAASSQILKSLAESGVMAFAATHDVELTEMLSGFYDNYHFEEEIVDDSIHFSYVLLKGKATTRNAIRLLGIMGYRKEVIESAEKTAEQFMQEGTWPVLQK